MLQKPEINDQGHVPAGLNQLYYAFEPTIDHFTVVGKVTWPLTGSEAEVDLVLIQTSLLLLCKSSCFHAN